MAIKQFREIGTDRGASISEDALVNRTRVWRVVTDNVQHDDYEIIEEFSKETGIRRGSPWSSIRGSTDPTCRAVALDAKQDFEAWTWIVTVNYTSGRAGSGGGTATPQQQRERAAMARNNAETGQPPSQDPVGRPMVVRWGSQEYQEALTTDVVDGITVMNSALQPYVPVPMRTLSYRTLTIERNELTFNPRTTWDYENTVNDATFYGFRAKSVLCKSIGGELEFEAGVAFARVVYVFWIRYPDWMLRIADMGVNELKPVLVGGVLLPRQLVPIFVRGVRVTNPVPLNGDGRKIDNPTHLPGMPNSVRYTEYNQFLTANFRNLGIGG